ncbi:MAG: dihydrolipoamide acetyltransferase family protein [Candidatus Binatia bacterium]
MVREFNFSDVGEGITEGEIIRWLVKEGEWIKEDQDLVDVETDKALVTIPSPYAGKVLKLHGAEGDLIKVGQVLASIEKDGEPSATKGAREKDAGTVVGALEEAEETVPPSPVQAIPSVRTLAKELQVDLTKVKGSGPGGRITKEDVETAAGKAPAKAGRATDPYGPVEKAPLRGMRRTIAKHMAEASKRVADVTILEDADITDLEKVRAKERKLAEQKGVKLTYLPFVIKAVTPALKVHPYLNATLDDELEQIVLKKYYNIGIAVDTPEGLMVFSISEADQKTILDLAGEIGDLAEKARSRKIDLAKLKGSTFTVTNYGVIGASYGTPIINYPEVAILGIGKIEPKPVVKSGKIVIRKIMPLSLVFDHRIIDGVEAARFLNEVIRFLEDPDLMLLEGK